MSAEKHIASDRFDRIISELNISKHITTRKSVISQFDKIVAQVYIGDLSAVAESVIADFLKSRRKGNRGKLRRAVKSVVSDARNSSGYCETCCGLCGAVSKKNRLVIIVKYVVVGNKMKGTAVDFNC